MDEQYTYDSPVVDAARSALREPVSFVAVDADGVWQAVDERGDVVGVLSLHRGWIAYAGDRFAAR